MTKRAIRRERERAAEIVRRAEARARARAEARQFLADAEARAHPKTFCGPTPCPPVETYTMGNWEDEVVAGSPAPDDP